MSSIRTEVATRKRTTGRCVSRSSVRSTKARHSLEGETPAWLRHEGSRARRAIAGLWTDFGREDVARFQVVERLLKGHGGPHQSALDDLARRFDLSRQDTRDLLAATRNRFKPLVLELSPGVSATAEARQQLSSILEVQDRRSRACGGLQQGRQNRDSGPCRFSLRAPCASSNTRTSTSVGSNPPSPRCARRSKRATSRAPTSRSCTSVLTTARSSTTATGCSCSSPATTARRCAWLWRSSRTMPTTSRASCAARRSTRRRSSASRMPIPRSSPPMPCRCAGCTPRATEFELLDKPIVFDDAQEAVRRLPAPVVLVGSAGSGKTAVTLAKLREAPGRRALRHPVGLPGAVGARAV